MTCLHAIIDKSTAVIDGVIVGTASIINTLVRGRKRNGIRRAEVEDLKATANHVLNTSHLAKFGTRTIFMDIVVKGRVERRPVRRSKRVMLLR